MAARRPTSVAPSKAAAFEAAARDVDVKDAPSFWEEEAQHTRWEEALAAIGGSVDALSKKELSALVAEGGMPLKHRLNLWPKWFTASAPPEAAAAAVSEVVSRQIDADVPRTCPRWLDAGQREALTRVLRANAAADPSMGYCQGVNHIAAVLLLLGFDEDAALLGLRSMLRACCPAYHSPGLDGFRRDALVLGALARQSLPGTTWQRFEALDVPMELLASEHFLTLASASWPLAVTARLWDLILLEGQPAVFASFLALMQLYLPDKADLRPVEGDMPGQLEEPEPVDVFRAAALRGVQQEPDKVMWHIRQLIPRCQQHMIDHFRFTYTEMKS